MTIAKEFSTLDVVTVTSGVLISARLLDAVYDVCGWMLDDTLMTHQLSAASRVVEPYIIGQHPWVASLRVPGYPGPALKSFCERLVETRGETLTLTRPDSPAWERGTALSDLVETAGDRPVIVVTAR